MQFALIVVIWVVVALILFAFRFATLRREIEEKGIAASGYVVHVAPQLKLKMFFFRRPNSLRGSDKPRQSQVSSHALSHLDNRVIFHVS